MLKKILIGLAVAIVVFVVVVALQPSDFRVERSASVSGSVPVVFEHVNNLKKWNEWSPWAKLDPNAKYTFDGPGAGVGSSFAWAGNSEVGEGKMTIVESVPNERVVMKLEFIKPFAATSMTEFTLKPDGNRTGVNWSMSGKNGFIGKAISLFMNCDGMVGGQFEQGLKNLDGMVSQPAGS